MVEKAEAETARVETAGSAADQYPAVSHGPISGSGRPSRWMNRKAQTAARPADSGSALRSLAYRLAQAAANTTTVTTGSRPTPRTAPPNDSREPSTRITPRHGVCPNTHPADG